MYIALIIGLLAAFISGFFVAIKSVSLGLKWQIQISKGEEPQLDNPISKVVDTKKQEEIAKYSKDQISEWMFGGGGTP